MPFSLNLKGGENLYLSKSIDRKIQICRKLGGVNMKKLKKSLYGLTLAASLASLFVVGANTPAKADSSTYFTGSWSGDYNSLDLSPSTAGEFLFGYANGCAYPGDNAFSHVGLVLQGSQYKNWTGTSSYWWDGPVVEATSAGTPTGGNSVHTNNWQTHFHYYDAASLDYFSKSGYPFNSSTVVNNATHYSGPYDVSSSYSNNTSWYCSKLASRAYYDNNGYDLGFLTWGSFIPPGDIYYDSAVHEIDRSISDKYDFNGPWAYGLGKQKIHIKAPQTFTYNGVTVKTRALNSDAKAAIDQLISQEKAEGKSAANLTVTLSDAKPGLEKHLNNLLQNNKATLDKLKNAYNLSADEIQN